MRAGSPDRALTLQGDGTAVIMQVDAGRPPGPGGEHG
jgi:hypothetical protein